MGKRVFSETSEYREKFPGENLAKLNEEIERPGPGDYVELFHKLVDESVFGILISGGPRIVVSNRDTVYCAYVVLCSKTGEIMTLSSSTWKCRLVWKKN